MLKNKTISELKALCISFDIEYSKNARKQDILEAIEEAGISWEDYENASSSLFDYKEAVEVKKEPEVINVPVLETTVLKEKLLTMIYNRGAYNAGNNIIFTMEEPFRIVPGLIAERMLRTSKNEIREATPQEALAFYGIER